MVKPGITKVGRLILDIFTLGSIALKDAAYSSAALDPTSLSGLALLQLGIVILTIPSIDVYIRTKMIRRNDLDNETDIEKEKIVSELNVLERKIKILEISFWVVFIPNINLRDIDTW